MKGKLSDCKGQHKNEMTWFIWQIALPVLQNCDVLDKLVVFGAMMKS